jgi:hypothetical protein
LGKLSHLEEQEITILLSVYKKIKNDALSDAFDEGI